MAALNFREIPEAHLGGGLQDAFELFARDFLAHLGYQVLESPSRGADGGKDVVVLERRTGIGGETLVHWLASCKHKAHSGASVTPQDESNIRDRVEANECQGFIGFYSTLPSSGLSDAIAGLSAKIETQIFDRERIEAELLRSPDGLQIARRYFPISTAAWMKENPEPAKIFAEQPSLKCQYCGKELLVPEPTGIIVIWHKSGDGGKQHIETIYWCCKGNCDRRLQAAQRAKGLTDGGWEDIPDVAIPLVFMRLIMSTLNQLRSGETYSADAFAQLKRFMLNMYPHIARHQTQEEVARIEGLMQIPAIFGGLGY